MLPKLKKIFCRHAVNNYVIRHKLLRFRFTGAGGRSQRFRSARRRNPVIDRQRSLSIGHRRQDKGQRMPLHGAQRLSKKALWIPVTNITVHIRPAVKHSDLSPGITK